MSFRRIPRIVNMKLKRDYGDLEWRTLHGNTVFWKDLEDRHLANIYAYFHSNPSKRQSFVYRHPKALAWLKQEAKRRKIMHLLKNVVEYGPYPYRDPYDGFWMVWDNDAQRAVSVMDCDVEKLPPDVRDEMAVLGLIGGLD